mmetsp:Transcript_36902/g.113967  ORF Transcript_36902/g.113967 Transcript_36902/m.113967 type:complete len:90 (+) Transcript_36902:1188-1457(+)
MRFPHLKPTCKLWPHKKRPFAVGILQHVGFKEMPDAGSPKHVFRKLERTSRGSVMHKSFAKQSISSLMHMLTLVHTHFNKTCCCGRVSG